MKPSNISRIPNRKNSGDEGHKQDGEDGGEKASKVPRRSGYSRGNRFNGLASTTGRCFRARRLGKRDGERERERERERK